MNFIKYIHSVSINSTNTPVAASAPAAAPAASTVNSGISNSTIAAATVTKSDMSANAAAAAVPGGVDNSAPGAKTDAGAKAKELGKDAINVAENVGKGVMTIVKKENQVLRDMVYEKMTVGLVSISG